MVNLCNEANQIDSRFKILAVEIKKLQEHFQECSLSFVRRELNVPAHLFARHVWSVQIIVTLNEILDFTCQAIWLLTLIVMVSMNEW